jgi:RNA polymerase sigma factor (sigma-70 family)
MKRTYQTYSDIELYELLLEEGQVRELAFSELYSRHSQRVYLYCRKVLGDSAADDVFQDTFIRFLNSVHQERTMTNVPAFILRIARNLCLNYKRDRKSNSVVFEDFLFPTTDNQVESQETARLITMALDLLSEERKEAIILQMYHGMSYEEIGECLHVPTTTVRNWIVRGKKQLRDILAPYFEQQPNQ